MQPQNNPPSPDSAWIKDHWREPVNIHTPETHLQAGRAALAAELTRRNIARELEYLVGSHAYLIIEDPQGRRSAPTKLF